MTPQTQAEQKARELMESIVLDKIFDENVALQELTLLIQKADALDWFEKFLISEGGYIDMEMSSTPYILANHTTDEEWKGETLLSAINQARKEQENILNENH